MRISDWSSDVCSSDLDDKRPLQKKPGRAFLARQAGRFRSFQERDRVFSVRGRDCLRKRGQVHYDREGEKDAREVLTVRLAGRISDWNDDKGYGFATPNGGGGRAFVDRKSTRLNSSH